MVFKWGILSKYKLELYGFSIIWIILYHGLNQRYIDVDSTFKFLKGFIKHGNCGVELFLFMSGISLFYSLHKNNDIHNFYVKRVKRLLFPFLSISGIYFFYLFLLTNYTISNLLLDITLMSFWISGNKIAWFVALIIPLYFFYPLIYKYVVGTHVKNSFLKTIFLCIVIYCLCVLLDISLHNYYRKVEIALSRIPVFLLGCFIGRYVFQDKIINKNILLLSLVFFVYGLQYFYLYQYSLVRAYRLPYLLVGPSIAIWLCVCLEILHNRSINRFLSKFGLISLELYLSHMVLREIFLKSSLYSTIHYKSNFVLYILICGFGAFAISSVVNCIHKKLYNKTDG